ncbi:neprilysin-1-like [Ornithodoros turicata]|uniref:neprilysin-1-like n=1 Tax=Ornithodoros turicata TaxID=34597 RepID=UPI003138A63B
MEQCKRRSWGKCGIAGLLGLPLVVLAVAAALGRRNPGGLHGPSRCATTPCRTAALALNISLSRTVGPCQDLDRFVCESWPGTSPAARVERILDYAWTAYRVPLRAQSALDKVVAVYQSCVASLSPGGGEPAALRPMLVPASPLRSLLQLSLQHRITLLLDVSRTLDNASLIVAPAPDILPPPLEQGDHVALASYVERVAALVLGSQRDPHELVHHVLTLQDELGREKLEESKQRTSRVLPLWQVAQMTGSLADWLAEVPGAQEDTPVVVQDVPWLKNLGAFLKRHQDSEELRHFVGWHTVRLLGSLTQYDIFRATLEQVLGGEVRPSPALVRATCLAHAANLMPAAYNTFVARHFATQASATRVLSLAETLRATALTGLRGGRWMPPRQRTRTLMALRQLVLIGPTPPGTVADLDAAYSRVPDIVSADFMQVYLALTRAGPGPGHSTGANQAALEPQYSPTEQSLFVPAGALQTPLYEDALPPAFNLGGLGASLADRLLQAAQRVWSTDAVAVKAFNHKANCQGAESLLRGTALRLAYRAFRRERRVVLAGLERFSPDQLFFLASCMPWCGSQGQCASAVKYMPEFASAFGCRAGDPMSPRPRCSLLV